MKKRVTVLLDHEKRCPDCVCMVPRSEKWCGKRVTGCATALTPFVLFRACASHPVPRSVPRKFREKTSQTLVLLESSTVPHFSGYRYKEKSQPASHTMLETEMEVSD